MGLHRDAPRVCRYSPRSGLTEIQMRAAMQLATDRHDAGIGYNWDYLTAIVEDIVSER